MDAVVLDWTIYLADKDKMKTCAVTYLDKEANESTTIDPFMPKTRTFFLENLRPNHVSSKLFFAKEAVSKKVTSKQVSFTWSSKVIN